MSPKAALAVPIPISYDQVVVADSAMFNTKYNPSFVAVIPGTAASLMSAIIEFKFNPDVPSIIVESLIINCSPAVTVGLFCVPI